MSSPKAARKGMTMVDAIQEFWRYPSPWVIGTALVAAISARVIVGDWQLTDAMLPFIVLALFPFLEWVIHTTVLHWKPRRIVGVTIDSQLARKHREHHVDPRAVPLIFIPFASLLGALALVVGVALFAFPRTGLGVSFLVVMLALGICYEWTHYLIHSDYKPKTALYKAVWRNHRLHHFKNEHYWFSVTTTGTSDRVLGTYPDPATVPSSPTAKNLHAMATAKDAETVGG
jgi:hypothetical protein